MIKTFFTVVLGLFVVFSAVAQTGTSSDGMHRMGGRMMNDSAMEEAAAMRGVVRTMRASTTEEIRAMRQDARQDIRAVRASTTEEMREVLRATMATAREDMKKRVIEKRDALKQGLLKIKDARKKQAVERIDARLDEINKNRTDHFVKNLEQIEDVLGRVIARADDAEARGRDVSAARSDSIAAGSAISAGRNAVQIQAAKTYPMVITGETQLRADVSRARNALQQDLNAARETVKAAHDAVRKAAVALAQAMRGLHEQEEQGTATSTATSTQQ